MMHVPIVLLGKLCAPPLRLDAVWGRPEAVTSGSDITREIYKEVDRRDSTEMVGANGKAR